MRITFLSLLALCLFKAMVEKRLIDIIEPILRLVPTVPRPSTPLPVSSRLFWTFLAITIYLFMSITPLYGVDQLKVSTMYNPLVAMIFASTGGTLMQLGIAPLIISGIILEILVFSGVLNIDLSDPHDQARFNGLYKLLALFIAFGETLVVIASGQLGPLTPISALLVIIQLQFATLMIILLDDMITKGWGIGSGISLFILVSILRRIFWYTFSPIYPTGHELPLGIIPALTVAVYHASLGSLDYLASLIYGFERPATLVGFISTIVLAIIILYIEMARVSIPLVITQYRGFKYTLPLRLMYVSVLPIIFTAFTLSLIHQVFLALWTSVGINNPSLHWLVCMKEIKPGTWAPCENSLMYFLWSPAPPNITPQFVIAHILIYIALATVFAYIWVNIAGMSAEDQAKYIVQGGLHIPGFRPSVKIIAKYLEKYISALTITSGVLAGLIAAIGDLLHVFSGGIGLILLVEIVLQYYALAMREQVFEIYPMLKRFIERE